WSSWCSWLASCVPCWSSSQVDPLFVKPLPQPLLQSGQRLGQRVGAVVLEGQPSVVQRPHHAAEPLLVAYFDVPVTPAPLRRGREQLLDALLPGGRLDHAPPVRLPLLPPIA